LWNGQAPRRIARFAFEDFRIELTVAKALGVLALLTPGVPRKAKEFAYAGFAITLVSASIAHFAVGDSVPFVIDPLLFLGALITSYIYFNKLNRDQSQRFTDLPGQRAREIECHAGERGIA